MYLDEIRDNALNFSANFTHDGFIYELLEAYGLPKSNISKMRQSSNPYLMTNKVIYAPSEQRNLENAIKELKEDPLAKKKKCRFLVSTDFTRLLAVDTKINDTLDIAVEDFFEEYGFFLPWTGREKVQVYEEVEADQKAAQKMAKLFDLIRIENTDSSSEFIDALNHFFTRLIFCFYAEDTGIFNKNAFTDYLEAHTDYDGSNTAAELGQIFKVLDTSNNKNFPNALQVFPYVNGGLFEEEYPIPVISARARRMLLECGKLDWRRINPDIFGSMFQGVMDEEIRHELGAHYTSIPNIMKVINPLFMDDLKEEFESCKGSEKKLKELQQRIAKIKIFDPACGSGNFLITAYKELRHLEMDIIDEIGKISGPQLGCLSFMTVDHFYGIEINPFAVELAKLSIWLAEHQMNVEFQDKFSVTVPSIPLKDSAKIVAANACRIDWEEVCPKDDEIYILGNPPYIGKTWQNKSQKEDMSLVFNDVKDFKSLDYICCWFYTASKYIFDCRSKFSFVSTNSIIQGEQAPILWPKIFSLNLKINFAYQSFQWQNSARDKAKVACIIVGLQNKIYLKKAKIYSSSSFKTVDNINCYLLPGKDIIITKHSKPISQITQMQYGNKPVDGGHLILDSNARDELIEKYPSSQQFLRKLIGSQELINGKLRWCLWINENNLESALLIPEIKERIEKVKEVRLASPDKGANKLAETPYRFRDQKVSQSHTIVIPRVSSERREYIPLGLLDNSYILTDRSQVLFDSTLHEFGIIISKIHMAWMRITSSRLEMRYQYTSLLTYNTFPIPNLKSDQKNTIEELSLNIIDARNAHPGKTLAELYDPDKMPQNLRDAHHELDLAVDAVYRKEPFKNDEERLTHLFKLYEKMTSGEKQ